MNGLHYSYIKNSNRVFYALKPLKDVRVMHIPQKYSKELSKKSEKVYFIDFFLLMNSAIYNHRNPGFHFIRGFYRAL